MSRVRRPPVKHQLAPVFDRAVDSLCVSLSPDTTRHYRGTTRKFLLYLGTEHPQLNSLDQLRRQPHILGWMSHLHVQSPPLGTASYINLLISRRCIFNELAWTEQLYELANLLRREDIPRLPRRLPRPLTPQQDHLLQQEFLRRNDLGEMTMRYLEVVLTDLQREFQLARSSPRHLAPQPKTSFAPLRTGLSGVIDSLLAAQHVLEMFRRALPNSDARDCLDRLSNRLTKIVAEARKLDAP